MKTIALVLAINLAHATAGTGFSQTARGVHQPWMGPVTVQEIAENTCTKLKATIQETNACRRGVPKIGPCQFSYSYNNVQTYVDVEVFYSCPERKRPQGFICEVNLIQTDGGYCPPFNWSGPVNCPTRKVPVRATISKDRLRISTSAGVLEVPCTDYRDQGIKCQSPGGYPGTVSAEFHKNSKTLDLTVRSISAYPGQAKCTAIASEAL